MCTREGETEVEATISTSYSEEDEEEVEEVEELVDDPPAPLPSPGAPGS